MYESADFVVSSDVFEHVPPPVEKAFENLYKILKNGGVCIFSVPYDNQGQTKEHFPDLYDFSIRMVDGKSELINKTRKGEIQIFDDLRFHGGDGSTLEMRLFSKTDLVRTLKETGFKEIRFYDQTIERYGIVTHKLSPHLILTMRK
jgi:SAM-dependent methyltransferase